MAITDLEGRFIRVNSALSRISGYSPQELLTRSYLDITHPDDVTEDREMDHRLVAGELPQFQRDKRYVCKNGQTRWISVSVALVSKDDGAPDYFMRQIQDIDAQKRMLDALRLSEERFRRTMMDAPIGMCLVSPEGKFQQVNQALCDLVGYSEDALLNLTFQNITHPDDLETDLGYVGELLAGKRSHYRMDVQMPEMDGITATQVILQEQGPDHPPIIALTAHALREEVDRCLAAGMVAHLTKPIEPGLLLETLHRLARPVGARIGSGAAEPVEAPRDFPGLEDLPGIQVDVLLSRTNHKAHIVQQVLEATLEHHRDDPDNLVALVQSGDRATLARQAHTLKGLGGTLGAMLMSSE